MDTIEILTQKAICLLERLIATPSVSRDEYAVSVIIEEALAQYGYKCERIMNNVLCYGHNYSADKPTILLNSHMDTVKPVQGWTYDPFTPLWKDGKLYGLGSNDAGASLVSLLYSFVYLDSKPQAYNLVFLATAEEEVTGANGAKLAKDSLPKIDLAIIGEPTGLNPGIAERGLLVLDVEVSGKSGHAARNEGINALYRAVDAISWFRTYRYEKESPMLGPVKMTVTIINSGTQHNVVPDKCTFTVDIRFNELYSNREIFDIVCKSLSEWCSVKARSFDHHSSCVSGDCAAVKRCVELGLEPYGSPTMSDQSAFNMNSFKIGPGMSERSHTANEYICMEELEKGVQTYVNILDGLSI